MTVGLSALTLALADFVEVQAESLAAARKSLGVSELESRALFQIAAEPGIRPSQLREHLGVTSAGVTTLVDRLVQRGLLRRELDDQDRRVNHIFLEVDLEEEPWSALARFWLDVDAAVRDEPSTAVDTVVDVLRRVTERARHAA